MMALFNGVPSLPINPCHSVFPPPSIWKALVAVPRIKSSGKKILASDELKFISTAVFSSGFFALFIIFNSLSGSI
jgi:hypothetical protein